MIEKLSASSIVAFDRNSSFGCERRWWYRYVKKLSEPQNPRQALGTKLHSLIEERLQLGRKPSEEHEAVGLYLAGEREIEEIAARKIMGIEHKIKSALEGIPFSGSVDVLTADGVVDWKTSSNPRKYGLKDDELGTDTQMVLYGTECHPKLERVTLTHVQFETQGAKRVYKVEKAFEKEALDSHRNNVIIPLVRRMKDVSKETDERKVEPDRKKCFNCHFKNICPNEQRDEIMSFFKAEFNPPTPVTEAKTVELLTESIAMVTPPDAPKSDPALAADPVKGEAPKKRGRPPGKTKQLSLAEEQQINDVVHELRPAVSPVTVKSMHITKGASINLGNFNNARIEISMEAEGSDHEALYKFLTEEIQKKLDAETSKFTAVK